MARKDHDLRSVIHQFGYPPMWTRPNSFATLIHIILEQQVSLASAKAAFDRLKAHTGRISPEAILELSDETMKACYFSRQKTVYARHLAETILSGRLNLKKLSNQPDEEVRSNLKEVKGIGDWTADIYLIFALRRTNIFPLGDLAMVKSLKELKQLPAHTGKEQLLQLSEQWHPYRSICTMLLWHHYLSKRKKN